MWFEGLKDLLEKLLACVPGETVSVDAQGRLIVYASNKRLAEMTHRDNDKAITRLITELEGRGLVARHASPNGKRYARQGRDGTRVAYGIDLGPMLARWPEIQSLAEAEADRLEACHQLREVCSVMLSRLATWPRLTEAAQALLDEGRKMLRRKPILGALEQLRQALAQWLGDPREKVIQTGEIEGSAPQTTCHKDSSHISIERTKLKRAPELTPSMIERALPKVSQLMRSTAGSIRDLTDLLLRCLGISDHLWGRCTAQFGYEESTLMVMVLYERQQSVRHAPAYLAHLIASTNPSTRPGTDALMRRLRH